MQISNYKELLKNEFGCDKLAIGFNNKPCDIIQRVTNIKGANLDARLRKFKREGSGYKFAYKIVSTNSNNTDDHILVFVGPQYNSGTGMIPNIRANSTKIIAQPSKYSREFKQNYKNIITYCTGLGSWAQCTKKAVYNQIDICFDVFSKAHEIHYLRSGGKNNHKIDSTTYMGSKGQYCCQYDKIKQLKSRGFNVRPNDIQRLEYRHKLDNVDIEHMKGIANCTELLFNDVAVISNKKLQDHVRNEKGIFSEIRLDLTLLRNHDLQTALNKACKGTRVSLTRVFKYLKVHCIDDKITELMQRQLKSLQRTLLELFEEPRKVSKIKNCTSFIIKKFEKKCQNIRVWVKHAILLKVLPPTG